MGRISLDFLKGLGIHDIAVVRMPQDTPKSNGRTMYIQFVQKGVKTKDWLKSWAVEIGAQVAAGKNVMVFYPFTEEATSWPTMHQVMKLICDEGNIDAEADTVMHFGKMGCKAKTKILSKLTTIGSARSS